MEKLLLPDSQRKNTKLSPENLAEIRMMRKVGLSYRVISNFFGVSPMAIKYRCLTALERKKHIKMITKYQKANPLSKGAARKAVKAYRLRREKYFGIDAEKEYIKGMNKKYYKKRAK